MAKEPYKLESSTPVFQGKHVSVFDEIWRTNEGFLNNYEVVHSPDAVVIVALDNEENILLVKQHRAGARGYILECPAGGVNIGEPLIDCARRELREETGFSSSTIVQIGNFWTIPGFASECMYVFLAKNLTFVPLEPDDDEDLELFRIPFKETLARARDGQFVDAKTIAALFLAEAFEKTI